MTANRRLVVIIPAWNEEASVGPVVREVVSHVPGAHVLVVDDGSTDGTAAAARAECVAVLSLPFNLGVGGAMRAGYLYAARGGFDIAVQVDADGQHDPAEIKSLVDALDHADIVIGARFAGTDGYAVRGPRRWAMRLLAWRLSRMAKTTLTDTTSGFRAVNRRVIALFAHDYPVEYLGDTVESLVVATRAGFRITQVPVTMRPRTIGAPSQTRWKATIYFLRAGLVLLLATIRRQPEVPTPADTKEHRP